MRNLNCGFLVSDEIWGFIGKKETHCRDTVTVSDVPPIASPELAVRAAIVKEYREREEKH
jgi:hypothetical protein